MTKRICFIRQSIYPYELSFRREVETLYQAGYITHVITQRDTTTGNASQPNEVIDGVFVHRLPLSRERTNIARYLYDYLAFTFLAGAKVTALHLREPFDVIQVNTMPDFLVFSTLIPKLLGARVTVMMQEPVPELWQTLHNTKPPYILKLAERMALAYVDQAFTVTRDLKQTYVQRGANPDKITVILNVPETRFLETTAATTPASTEKKDFTLICHGAIEERYGQDTMLDAIALIRSQIPNLRLRILGGGSYVDQFMAKRAELKLEDCVDYLGWVPLAQMVQEIRSADVGIVAQKSSSYSNLVHTNKMYEYMALGKPVLASRLNSVRSYFDDTAICYFEPGSPDSLAQGILELYRNPNERETLVRNAQKLYEQYKWEKQKQLYLSVYDTLTRPRVAVRSVSE